MTEQPQRTTPTARPATAEDRDRVVATVAAAFAADPAFGYFFAGSYAADVTIFAGNLFDHRLRLGTVWVVDDGAAVSMWNPPGAPHADVTAGLSSGARSRLDQWDSVVHGLTPAEPHWYLGVLATHPDHAGRRLGRIAMQAGLDRAQADGLPAYLETATDTNIAIYRASGWTVVATASVEGRDVTVMRYDTTLVD